MTTWRISYCSATCIMSHRKTRSGPRLTFGKALDKQAEVARARIGLRPPMCSSAGSARGRAAEAGMLRHAHWYIVRRNTYLLSSGPSASRRPHDVESTLMAHDVEGRSVGVWPVQLLTWIDLPPWSCGSASAAKGSADPKATPCQSRMGRAADFRFLP